MATKRQIQAHVMWGADMTRAQDYAFDLRALANIMRAMPPIAALEIRACECHALQLTGRHFRTCAKRRAHALLCFVRSLPLQSIFEQLLAAVQQVSLHSELSFLPISAPFETESPSAVPAPLFMQQLIRQLLTDPEMRKLTIGEGAFSTIHTQTICYTSPLLHFTRLPSACTVLHISRTPPDVTFSSAEGFYAINVEIIFNCSGVFTNTN